MFGPSWSHHWAIMADFGSFWAIWGFLWDNFGDLFVNLGPSQYNIELSWTIFGAPIFGSLGALFGLFWGFLEPSWGNLGTKSFLETSGQICLCPVFAALIHFGAGFGN